jgi:hypothetical protein
MYTVLYIYTLLNKEISIVESEFTGSPSALGPRILDGRTYTDKKENKIFLIRKFRVEQLQSHI